MSVEEKHLTQSYISHNKRMQSFLDAFQVAKQQDEWCCRKLLALFLVVRGRYGDEFADALKDEMDRCQTAYSADLRESAEQIEKDIPLDWCPTTYDEKLGN